MKLEIINAKKTPLGDEDVRSIVEIERHPMVKKWLIDYADENFEKELEELYKKQPPKEQQEQWERWKEELREQQEKWRALVRMTTKRACEILGIPHD